MFDIQRNYKDKLPMETVNRIRDILINLDIFTKESYWGNPYSNLFSVSISTSHELGRFSTNGKGQYEDYCLASAYGEFMERLQNNLFLLNISLPNYQYLKDKFGFYSYPDEIFLSETELRTIPKNVLKDIFGVSEYDLDRVLNVYYKNALKRNGKGCLAVPFFSFLEKKVIYLPYNLLLSSVGSNGMAAGNSKEEAVSQALFELMERWGSSIIFHEQLTPPDIPKEYLAQYPRELAIINELEKDSLLVKVKDFSGGIGLPVLGVMVIDVINNSYHLDVGSDSSFQVALSRCITELYQGIANSNQMHLRMMRIPEENPEYFGCNSNISQRQREDEFCKFTVDGMGRFPVELFKTEPSYKFAPNSFCPKNDFSQEINHWIKHITKLGYDVLIRDISFLGFPSYHVYIPNVASVGMRQSEKKYDFDKLNNFELAIELCLKLSDLNNTEILYIAGTLSQFDLNKNVIDLFGLEFDSKVNTKCLSICVFVIILYVIASSFSKAYEFLKKNKIHIINEKEIEFLERFQILITAVVNNLEIVDDFKDDPLLNEIFVFAFKKRHNKRKIIKLLSLPTCPKCDICEWNRKCLTSGRLKLFSYIAPHYIEKKDHIKQHFNFNFG